MSLDRTQAPNIQQATSFVYHLPDCDKHVIADNTCLYNINSGTQDVVSFEIYIPRLLKSPEEVAVSKACTALLKSGTSQLSALQINEQIENVGANLTVSQNNDFFIIKLQSLSKHFIKFLPLLLEILQDVQFPAQELEVYRQQAIQHMAVNLKKSDFVANRTIDKLIYGFEHPYGSHSELADFETLTREAIISFHKEYFHFDKASFFLAGKYDKGLLESVKNTLSQLDFSAQNHLEVNMVEKADELKKHRLENDSEALQGAIRIAKRFIDREHEDFIPMMFVNTLFGGYFGSRLMSNIREDKGYTYGIYSFVQQNMHGNSYVIGTDVGKDVAEKAVKEVWHEMNVLRTKLVDEEELQLVKNYILGSILSAIDGPFKIMSRWKSLILNGQDADYFNQSITTYKNIEAERIMELANKYYQPEDFYNLIVY